MCGRFTLALTAAKLQEIFHTNNTVDIDPRYNIAPTQNIPVIVFKRGKDVLLKCYSIIDFYVRSIRQV
jgi:putative SOS response-associated peptidase YedK